MKYRKKKLQIRLKLNNMFTHMANSIISIDICINLCDHLKQKISHFAYVTRWEIKYMSLDKFVFGFIVFQILIG